MQEFNRENVKQFRIQIPDLIKFYEKKHQVKLFIENENIEKAVMPSQYSQKPKILTKENPCHITQLDIKSEKMHLNLQKESCKLCEFDQN